MHELMLREVVKRCRQRESEGDRPTEPAFSVEQLEDAVNQLARQPVRNWETMTPREVFEALKVAPLVAGPWAPHDGYGSKAAARFDPYGVIVLFDRGTGWGVSSFAPKDPFDDEEQFDTRKDADERLREIGWLLCDEEPASSPASGTDAPANGET